MHPLRMQSQHRTKHIDDIRLVDEIELTVVRFSSAEMLANGPTNQDVSKASSSIRNGIERQEDLVVSDYRTVARMEDRRPTSNEADGRPGRGQLSSEKSKKSSGQRAATRVREAVGQEEQIRPARRPARRPYIEHETYQRAGQRKLIGSNSKLTSEEHQARSAKLVGASFLKKTIRHRKAIGQ